MRVLFLDLDTLRPDHLGCYGYHRDTSPNLDRIASEGTVFTQYYCSDAPCLPSRAALFSGRFGIHSGAVGHGGTTGDMDKQGEPRSFRSTIGTESLPCLMRAAGLHTATISPFGERHASFWFYSGFNEMHNTGRGGSESAEEVTPVALDWIHRNARSEDWFLHVNYWDPHTPYRAPAAFGNPFADEPLPEWLTEDALAEQLKHVGPHSAWEYGMYTDAENPDLPRQPGKISDMAGVRKAIDGYDCGIRYMDDHIGMLLSAFEEEGVLDDLIIIVSSDHGENMGELGIWGEHATADGITPHIPMIIRWPGRGQQGATDNSLHYNLDLGPTLAEMCSLPPMDSWDGQSYAAALTDGVDCGREELILSQCAHVCQRSVRFGDWIYMRTYHDGYHLFPQEMLYNLNDDPHEQCDLTADRPDLCQEGAWRLLRWHDAQMATRPDAVDPLWTTIREGGPFHAKGHLPGYVDRLEATGRGWAVPELKRRHPNEFK